MESNNQPLLEYIETDSEEEIRTVIEEQRNDTINDRPLFKPQEPKDKFYMVYCLFYVLGISSLLPWNFFITANNYWMYKFRDPKNKFFLVDTPSKLTPMQASFTSYLSIASNVPTLLFYIVTALFNQRISFQARIIGSLLLMLVSFIITTVFVNINTDTWQHKFLTFTLINVVFVNASSAVLTSSVIGLASKFSARYITALVSGQALSATFAAIAQIMSLAFGASSSHSAFIYFMVGNFTILVTLISYIVLSKSVYYKFNISNKMGVGINEFENELIRPSIICHKTIFKKMWGYCLSIFLVFFITLSVYPSVAVLFESQGKGKWNTIYFVPVITYLLMSLCDYFGRVLAGFFHWPQKSIILNTFGTLRLIFVPLIIFCNIQPRGSALPVVFDSDYYYIVFIILFGLSNGYLANATAILIPRIVDIHERDTASLMFTISIGFGVTFGSLVSAVLVTYV